MFLKETCLNKGSAKWQKLSHISNMLLLSWISFNLMLILVSCSKDQGWIVDVNPKLVVENGSNVTVNCSFSYPEKFHTPNVKIYWKTDGTSECSTTDFDKNAFVFHENSTCMLPRFRGRAKLIGDQSRGNCSLQILKVTRAEFIYLRVVGSGEQYSFRKNFVSISLKDVVSPTLDSSSDILGFTTMAIRSVPQGPTSKTYLIIFVPAVAVLIIAVVGGVVYNKRKRSRSALTREESNYYLNYRKSSTTKSKEATEKTPDLKKSEQMSDIDPVYMNVQNPVNRVLDQIGDTNNIYVNVDFAN